jgi:transcriptional regulator
VYLPRDFRIDDPAVQAAFMAEHNFATLVSTDLAGSMRASHVPFIVRPEGGERGRLIGHLARANPQWRDFDGQREALAIFQGPHGYVSPSLYETHPSVPTWNFMVVHAYGVPKLIEDYEAVRGVLAALVAQHESGREPEWRFDLPDAYVEGMAKQIVAFEIDIKRVEAKFKLSQNRPEADRSGVTSAFEAAGDAVARELGRAMREYAPRSAESQA